MYWIIVGLSAGFVVGIALLILGLHGRRVGDEHRCRKCTYDLTGLTADRCPECGTTITPKTTVHGLRQRRKPALVTGLLLMVLAVGTAGYRTYTWASKLTYRDYPVIVLTWKAKRGDVRAVRELTSRIQRGQLDPQSLQNFVDTAINRFGQAVAGWEFGAQSASAPSAWGELLDEFTAVNLLSPAQKQTLVKRCFRFSLDHRPRLRQGDPLGMSVELLCYGITRLPFDISASWKVVIDGQDVVHESTLDWTTRQHPISRWGNRDVVMTKQPPGGHRIALLTQNRISPPAGETGWSAFNYGTEWSGTLRVLPPDAPDPLEIVHDEQTATAFQDALQVTMTTRDRQNKLHDGIIWMRVDEVRALPLDAVFQGVLKGANGESIAMNIEFRRNDPMSQYGRYFPFSLSRLERGIEYTPVLRAAVETARRTPDLMEVFGGELSFEPFTLESLLAEDEAAAAASRAPATAPAGGAGSSPN